MNAKIPEEVIDEEWHSVVDDIDLLIEKLVKSEVEPRGWPLPVDKVQLERILHFARDSYVTLHLIANEPIELSIDKVRNQVEWFKKLSYKVLS